MGQLKSRPELGKEIGYTLEVTFPFFGFGSVCVMCNFVFWG
jgi:hypothetical protein